MKDLCDLDAYSGRRSLAAADMKIRALVLRRVVWVAAIDLFQDTLVGRRDPSPRFGMTALMALAPFHGSGRPSGAWGTFNDIEHVIPEIWRRGPAYRARDDTYNQYVVLGGCGS